MGQLSNYTKSGISIAMFDYQRVNLFLFKIVDIYICYIYNGLRWLSSNQNKHTFQEERTPADRRVSVLVLLCGWDDPAWVWTCGIAMAILKTMINRFLDRLKIWSFRQSHGWLSGFVGCVMGELWHLSSRIQGNLNAFFVRQIIRWGQNQST